MIIPLRGSSSKTEGAQGFYIRTVVMGLTSTGTGKYVAGNSNVVLSSVWYGFKLKVPMYTNQTGTTFESSGRS